ncbi:MAG: transcription termination factor Rho, partial [Acidobacteriota bacterium]|nr:transcription termination factor Rho [Acidobacteriota bacterium]
MNIDIQEIKQLAPAELVKVAATLRVNGAGNMPYRDVLCRVIQAHARNRETISAVGVLERLSDGYGFLRAPDASYLPPSQVRRFSLQTGDTVRGQIRLPKSNERYLALGRVESVNDLPTEQIRKRKAFDKLTPLYPEERIRCEIEGVEDISGRVLDLMTPLGKGQRGLIVSPPRAGTT